MSGFVDDIPRRSWASQSREIGSGRRRIGGSMRIAIFSDSLPPRVDGIAVAVRHLASGLVRSGHQVLLVGPGAKPGRAMRLPPSGFGLDGVQFLSLPSITTGFDGYPFTVPLRAKMNRALLDFRPNVVSSQTVGPIGLTGLSLANRIGAATLFTWHTDFEVYGQTYRFSPRLIAAGSYCPYVLGRPGVPSPPRPRAAGEPARPAAVCKGLIPASLRRASRWMSAVCAPSTDSADQVRRFGLQRPVYLMPAEVTPEDLGVGSTAAQLALNRVPDAQTIPYLLFVGRLSREKNLGLLLEAFIRKVPAPTRLVLVGPANDARMRAILQARAAQLPGRIILVDALPRNELGEIYRCASAFVTPSLSETQCLVISEAVALAVPVLVVDPHLAEDRPTGAIRVVPADPDALGSALTDAVRAGYRGGARPSMTKPTDSLAVRFVAAADTVRAMPVGATLHWDEGRWIRA